MPDDAQGGPGTDRYNPHTLHRLPAMPLTQRIHDQFQTSSQTLEDAAGLLAEPIGRSARLMTDCLLGEGKILVCGAGTAGLAGRHLAAILADRLEKDRPGLAAVALRPDAAALTDEADPARGFARQVEALGHPGDVLLAFSTYGQSQGVAEAVRAAREMDMRVIALSGGDGGRVAEALGEHDVLICMPAESAPRILETTLVAVHCLCDGIDYFLLGA
jgi:D-sedoheptulose 7-phosphate isomerase